MLKQFLKITSYLILALGFSLASADAYDDFFSAVTFDDVRAVHALLQRGMDPNSRNEQGQPALSLALREDSFKVAELLLSAPGIDLEAANAAGETPLMLAVLRGQVAWARKLLEHGAKVDRPGWSPVLYAASGPDSEALRLLLDRGAPVDARSPNGSTPLMMAARHGPEPAVDLLLERGADPRLRNQRQLSAADFARQAGRDELADRLAALAR